MTYQRYETLVIVFGAGGRLGRALLPVLATGPWVVVAVARNEKQSDPSPNVQWIKIDVTEVDLWERSLHVFCSMADIYERVIIVDLLLDKTATAAIRRSLAAGSSYIIRLRSRLATVDRPVSLVLASTTAVLSPWLYQTPYGLAKRRQLTRYASVGMTGWAVLLPQLVAAEADQCTTSAHLVWLYAEGADAVLRAVSAARFTEPATLRLVVPLFDRSLRRAVASRPLRLRTFAQVLKLHVASWTTQRDSPQAHRLASHGRLELTPQWLRRQVDHHIVPAGLVHRLTHRLRTLAAISDGMSY